MLPSRKKFRERCSLGTGEFDLVSKLKCLENGNVSKFPLACPLLSPTFISCLSGEKLWLGTHVWHAKRMHMTDIWGYRLVSPVVENEL